MIQKVGQRDGVAGFYLSTGQPVSEMTALKAFGEHEQGISPIHAVLAQRQG